MSEYRYDNVMPVLDATYSTYRCDKAFDGLINWLREKGIDAQKPIHELRKEFGSSIVNEHGIDAASRALRHTDIAITARHYADKKRRVTSGFGKLFTGDKSQTAAAAKPTLS